MKATTPRWVCAVAALAAMPQLLPGRAAPAQAQPVRVQAATNYVGLYEKVEFRLEVSGSWTNPFDSDEVEVSLQLAVPGARSVTVPAFYCQDFERQRLKSADRVRDWLYPRGNPSWKARFAPMQTGDYSAVGMVKQSSGTRSSSAVRFTSGPSASRGFVRVSGKDPRFLEFYQGQPYFPIGQNLAFIGSQQYVTLSKAEEIFDKLAENGANYLRIWTCCDDWATAIEAHKSAWGRSWDWHPPIVPMPGENNGRKCLKLPSTGSALRIDPSHPVALRPGTRYVLSGKVRIEAGAAIKLEGNHFKPPQSIRAGPAGSWRSFQSEFETGPDDFWLEDLSLRAEGSGSAWIRDLSLKEVAGGPELLWEADINRSMRGFYNPLDCFVVDELVASAEHHLVYLQLCLLTRDLYMSALKDPASPQYERAIQDARKFLRYAVARWGYSTSIAAWEYWNEMDPGLPTDRFYTALGVWLDQIDPYHHLRTTSTWGPSAKDCLHPKLDFADTHFYLRPADKGRLANEVDAVLERTRWLREQAPHKPAHLGEFGVADEKWALREEMKISPELADFHNALWASTLSGASGTAMFWWWERLDLRNAYPVYRRLSRFIADVPWTNGELKSAAATCSDARLRLVGLQTSDRAWIWLFNPEASWTKIAVEGRLPSRITGTTMEVKALTAGTSRVRWVDTRKGDVISEEKLPLQAGLLRLTVPDFDRDIACRISP